MSKRSLFLLIVGILLVSVAASYAIVQRGGRDTTTDSDQLTVAVTIFPLADMVKNIGGEHVKVIMLVPPGANEHSYALSAAQVAQVAAAKTIFAIGQKLDNHIVDPLQRAHGIPITIVDQGIMLREYNLAAVALGEEEHDETEAEPGHDEGVDPHFWLTIPNGQRIAATIAQELVKIDPSHQAQYAANLATYTAQLTRVENELQQLSRTAPHKNFIAMHNGWSYLAPHYGFNLLATYEPVEGSQPSLTDLQHLGELIKQYQITVFFAEPQKVSSSATKVMRDEFGLRIDILDPTGGIGDRDSYIDLMRANINALAR